MENMIQRGDIFFISLDPTRGREIGGNKERPVVVMSINDIHQKTRIVAVVPGTSSKSLYRNVVQVNPDEENGLKLETYFQCHQIRAVDQGRMTARPIGRLSKADFGKVEMAVRHSLGLIVR